jgi:hypothetical protein
MNNDIDSGTHEDAGSDVEIEVADVSRSGHVRVSQRLGGGLSPRQRFWRRLIAVGLVALLVVVLALNLSGRLTPQLFMAKPPAPHTLRPQAVGMNCLLDAAWSPQGTRLALLGDQHAQVCPATTSGQKAGLVTVFDATTGKLLATLHPDDAIVRAISTFAQRAAPAANPPAAQIATAITYQHVLWSPNGRQMALTFSFALSSIGVNLSLPDREPEDLQGVLLLNTDGAHSQVILQVESAYRQAAVEWDLNGDAIVAASAPPALIFTFGPLTPAVAYRWQTGATPVAVTPLSSKAVPPVPPLGSVGNPAGGAAFTIWQPGEVNGVAVHGPGGLLTPVPGVYELRTTFLAWSPDGRYLLDAVVPDGVLALPGTPSPTQDQLSAYGVAGVPLLPLRDAGLARALHAVNPIDPSGTYLTWRPDGRVLAAYSPENAFAIPPVMFYDCATGRQLTSLRPPALGYPSVTPALLGEGTLLRWSPDGTRLLLYALPLGQVVLWGSQQLPH